MSAEIPDWFHMYADRYFEVGLKEFAGKPDLLFLQIGAFAGHASEWLIQNVLTGRGSRLVDVDTWGGSQYDPVAHPTMMDWNAVESAYQERCWKYQGKRLTALKATSDQFFYRSPWSREGDYDFIYIDGDHTAIQVLKDAVNAWRLLREGGVLAFDDYLWESGNGKLYDPRQAIDAFLSVFGLDLEFICNPPAAQVWVRKVKRRGWSVNQVRSMIGLEPVQ